MEGCQVLVNFARLAFRGRGAGLCVFRLVVRCRRVSTAFEAHRRGANDTIAEEQVVAAARRRVRGIADTLREIFARAERGHTTALSAAMTLARQRLAAADGRVGELRSPA